MSGVRHLTRSSILGAQGGERHDGVPVTSEQSLLLSSRPTLDPPFSGEGFISSREVLIPDEFYGTPRMCVTRDESLLVLN